jgi:medium-chain acyl-[acyl-carrier-protein] hydrolase
VKIERLSAWVMAVRAGHTPARARVFCFPHAGGGASAYTRWGADAPEGIEFCAVQLPGREGQIGARPFSDLPALLPALRAELQPYFDRPFAFFGHSMGALIAFELASALQADAGRAPMHLFVSGRRAPHLPPARRPLHQLPPGEFEAALLELEGTPNDILADEELMALIGPTLRADLAVCETYQHHPRPALAMPLSAFGGADDPEATPGDLDAWRAHTSQFAGVRLFPGRHFYLRERTRDVVTAIAGAIAAGSETR